MRILKKAKELLSKRRLKKNELVSVLLFEEFKKTQGVVNMMMEHLIAMARLGLIKPDRLKKESKNNKANAEYLLEMLKEEKQNENNEKTN